MADAPSTIIKGTARSFGYFSKVKEAREYLKEQAKELLELQKSMIMQAAAKGDFESALKANQWLIEHMPNEDNVRMIDSSASEPTQIEGPKGPQIAIGINLGGAGAPKLLTKVIDVDPEGNE